MDKHVRRHLDLRYIETFSFLDKTLKPPAKILDIGNRNELSDVLNEKGFEVLNTVGDLDVDPQTELSNDVDVVTAFEIFEHMVAPYNLLKDLKAPRLFASVPMRLWFKSAYRNKKDHWDSHYHEFEDWQFDWLLDKAGWEIVRSKKWTSPTSEIGIRPLLRRYTNRYYMVEAVRKKSQS